MKNDLFEYMCPEPRRIVPVQGIFLSKGIYIEQFLIFAHRIIKRTLYKQNILLETLLHT
jgi:hypothetical protein